MKIKKLNESMLPSQATLDDCLDDYRQNAFGFDGVEDYVDTNYPMHSQEFKAAVCDYLKSHKNESLQEAWQVGDEVVIKWNEPGFEPYAYATCEYQGKTEDGKHRFKSTTYGWDFIVDLENKKIKTPHDKEYDLWDESGWTKNATNESKSINEDIDDIFANNMEEFCNKLDLEYKWGEGIFYPRWDAYSEFRNKLNAAGLKDITFWYFQGDNPDKGRGDPDADIYVNVEDEDSYAMVEVSKFPIYKKSKSIKEDVDKLYDVYRVGNTLELVRMIKADSLDSAKEKASKMGYDLEYYRVEESDDLDESKSIKEDIEDIVAFEKEMVQKHPELRKIEESETMDSGATRYIAWLKFPYFSSDSNGGFFSFFSEGEFDKWINSLGRWRVEQDKLINDTNTPFEPDQYEEFCDTYKTYDEKYNAALKVLRSNSINEEWNKEWDNIGIEIEKAAREQHIGVDFINTDISVMGAFTATFEINRGDWKHDHWAFDEVVKEYLANNEKYALWKIDTNQIGSSEDDSYSAEHIAFIVPKDKMELLNSMKGLFAESVNPADLTDCPECGDVSFDSKTGKCTKCNYRESLNEALDENPIIAWLSEHEQAWEDFTAHFSERNIEELSDEEIIDWISEHDQLYDDYKKHFKTDDFAEDITNESLVGLELDKDDILDWLAEHEQAWEDAERYFAGGQEEVPVKDLVGWIADHKQLYDDFYRFFYEDNLDEEFLNFEFDQNIDDDDVEGIIQ